MSSAFAILERWRKLLEYQTISNSPLSHLSWLTSDVYVNFLHEYLDKSVLRHHLIWSISWRLISNLDPAKYALSQLDIDLDKLLTILILQFPRSLSLCSRCFFRFGSRRHWIVALTALPIGSGSRIPRLIKDSPKRVLDRYFSASFHLRLTSPQFLALRWSKSWNMEEIECYTLPLNSILKPWYVVRARFHDCPRPKYSQKLPCSTQWAPSRPSRHSICPPMKLRLSYGC